mmetsp:Transcript_109562/g.309079  ORF Transcript_109562/g.309079 Transcript_109562/m.309079 type:complete len:237 (+) Transcript_109562:611-1321(+)
MPSVRLLNIVGKVSVSVFVVMAVTSESSSSSGIFLGRDKANARSAFFLAFASSSVSLFLLFGVWAERAALGRNVMFRSNLFLLSASLLRVLRIDMGCCPLLPLGFLTGAFFSTSSPSSAASSSGGKPCKTRIAEVHAATAPLKSPCCKRAFPSADIATTAMGSSCSAWLQSWTAASKSPSLTRAWPRTHRATTFSLSKRSASLQASMAPWMSPWRHKTPPRADHASGNFGLSLRAS